MSDLAVVMICATVVVVAAIISGTYYSLKRPDPVAESRRRMLDAEDRARRSHVGSEPWYDVPEVTRALKKPDPEPEPESMAPIPVDPNNPPVPRTYNRRPGSTAPVPKCFCHGRELQSGQQILWWPVPDSGEVRIYCQREDS